MKTYLLIAVNLFVMSSCTRNITDLNKETKHPLDVPSATLFSSATKTLADNLASASVNVNVWRFTVKHWAMTTYQEEAQFDFSTRNINGRWWNSLYRDVLVDLKDGANKISANSLLDEKIKKNQLAILDIMQVYAFSMLVNTFGDIPYSQALNIEKNLMPVYDDAATIYEDLLKRLETDISNLSPSVEAFSKSEDLIYKGDIQKWIKFAHTLRFKMGMLLADVNPEKAKTHVEAADADAFSGNDDNALFVYLATPPNTNPLYTDIVIGSRDDYIAAKDLMDILLSLDDPRVPLYFKPNSNGKFVGGIVGAQNTYADNSAPGDRVSAPTAPLNFLDFSELEFLRAEAKERGFNVRGTAEEHYNKAITSSIKYWGGSQAQADRYLANPKVKYATASNSWKEKIALQKWIALYNRPYDGWVEIRRLDVPKLELPVNAKSGYPNRFSYPQNEQLVNQENYAKAAAKIGGDKVETKLFWDKN